MDNSGFQALLEAQRQKAFYDAGGKDPGNSNFDQFTKGFGTIQNIGNAYLGVRKAQEDIITSALNRKAKEVEIEKNQGEITPVRDLALPLNSQTMSRNATTTPEQIKAQDEFSAAREAMGGQTLAQAKTQAEMAKTLAEANYYNKRPGETTIEDVKPAIEAYTPAYIKKVLPDVTDEDIASGRIKIGQVKSAITTNNQSGLNEDRDLARNAIIEDRKQRDADRKLNIRTAVVTRFNSLAQVKKTQSSIDAADNVIDLISSNNPLADNAVPTYMARASGEVGNLSEADKAPFGGSQAILTRMGQAISQASSGKLTPENREFVRQLAETMKASALRNLTNHAKNFSKQYGKLGGYGDEKEIFSTISPDFDISNSTGIKTGTTSSGISYTVEP